jgi:hypothetical protein
MVDLVAAALSVVALLEGVFGPDMLDWSVPFAAACSVCPHGNMLLAYTILMPALHAGHRLCQKAAHGVVRLEDAGLWCSVEH